MEGEIDSIIYKSTLYTAYLYKIITYSLEVRWAIIVASLLLIMSIGSYAVQRKIRFKIVTLFLLSLLAIQILPKVLNLVLSITLKSLLTQKNYSYASMQNFPKKV